MINKDKYAFYFYSNYGPQFGNLDFGLERDMKKGKSSADILCYFLSNNDLELTGGKGESEEFDVEEFEVYKVIF